jgi:hypothetical protein
MCLFLMKITGPRAGPLLWERGILEQPSTPEVDMHMLPNMSLAVDPLALPSLRSLLLGSRFTQVHQNTRRI